MSLQSKITKRQENKALWARVSKVTIYMTAATVTSDIPLLDKENNTCMSKMYKK